MPRAPLAVAAVLLSVATLTGCWLPSAIRAKTSTTEVVEHVPGSSLRVESRNGSIQVIASADQNEVKIEADIVCEGATQEEAERRAAATSIEVGRDTSRTLTIRAIFPDEPRGNDGVSFRVLLPGADGVTAKTSNGSIAVEGTPNALAGALVARTSNGSVKVHGHRGSTEIETANGAVTVMDGYGPLDVRTSNGAITVAMAGEASGPMRLQTSNGRMNVKVGEAFTGSVSMSTSNGTVVVTNNTGRPIAKDLDKNGGTIVIGDGSVASTLRTSNGSIEVTIGGD